MQEKAPVSVVIIAKNEEKRIEDCLKTCLWAKEIVIVDDLSTDKTVEIASRYTDKIFKRQMDVEGKHRNFAYDQATQPWVLSLDADERVTPELAGQIHKAVTTNPEGHVCYSMPMKTFLGDEWLSGAGYYPAAKSKLFQQGKYRYDEKEAVHPRVHYTGTCGRLSGELIHYSFDNLEHWLRKFNRETSLEAQKWFSDGRKIGLPKILRKSVDRFLKAYLVKKGWKMGFLGYLMSSFSGLYQLVTYGKYRELRRKSSVISSQSSASKPSAQ